SEPALSSAAMDHPIRNRDAPEEAYSPAKINGWGEWAAQHLGDKVDWSSVVMDAVQALGDKT
ncbi:hypothetical protein ACLBPA_29525, partial [Klebsiella pneumoniae]|uniref:hypothetical protein n=1 Tax=Klebsiella pneumoniae TaxID=573 RepID=UPI0039694D98